MNETVDVLFDYAIELEKAAESLYESMAALFSHEPNVKQFWLQYAKEERGHASYLEKVRKAMSAEDLAQPAEESILQQAHRSLQDAANLDLGRIRNLEDAYQLATNVENSETNAIFDFMMTNFSTEELAKSYKFLKVQLSSHIKKLEREFPEPYQSRDRRRALMVRKK